MEQFFSFFIVIFATIFFSTVFSRLDLPWVLALIVGGIIIGPDGLDFFQPSQTMDFLAQIGLVFLIFMAGFETKLSSFKEFKKEVLIITLLNSLIPFGVGFLLIYLLGYSTTTALFMGIIFISSSVSVIMPSLEAIGSILSKYGSGFLAGRFTGFSKKHSHLVGASTIPQLSTTLAVVFTGGQLGILPPELITAMVALSMITVFLAPMLVKFMTPKLSNGNLS